MQPQKEHHLKSYPEYFVPTIAGNKTHELRADTDAGPAGGPFAVGDLCYTNTITSPPSTAVASAKCRSLSSARCPSPGSSPATP